MVILMTEDSRKKEVAHVLAALRSRGLQPRIISNTPRVVLGVVEKSTGPRWMTSRT